MAAMRMMLCFQGGPGKPLGGVRRDYWAAGLFKTGGRAHTGNVSLSSQSKSHAVGTLEKCLALYVLKRLYTKLSGFSLLSL